MCIFYGYKQLGLLAGTILQIYTLKSNVIYIYKTVSLWVYLDFYFVIQNYTVQEMDKNFVCFSMKSS